MDNYDDLKFSDAFSKAYREKGSGKTFSWKGKSYLLEKAEPTPRNIKEESFQEAFSNALALKGEGSTFKWKNKDFVVEVANKKPRIQPVPTPDTEVFKPIQPAEPLETVEVEDKGYFKMNEPVQEQMPLNLDTDGLGIATGQPTKFDPVQYFKPFEKGDFTPVVEKPSVITTSKKENFKIPYVNTGESYFAWSKEPDAVADSNKVLQQEAKAGNIQIEKKGGKEVVDENGNFSYTIITDEYKKKFNDWIDQLNSKSQDSNDGENLVDGVNNLISDVSDSINDVYQNVSDTVVDYSEMLGNYINRRIDSDVVKTKKLEVAPVLKGDLKVFKDQMNLTSIPVGDGFASSGVINLKDNLFEARNRDDMETVADGKGVAITTFRPFKRGENQYKNFQYVLAKKKDGSAEIIERGKVDDSVDLFTGIDVMPFENIKITKGADGKDYVDVEKTEDFNGYIVSMGKYNSGIGVGREQKDGKAPLDGHASEYSQLIGGKVLMKTKDQQILVSGSFKNMWDAYQTLKQKTKETPVVFKVDNGSFNTTYFKKENGITSKDLRKHQNRNNKGGHALILRNPDNKFQDGGMNTFDMIRPDIPVSSNGLYDHPNQEVIVPTQSGNITVKGIGYPVLGKSLETGEEQMMQPQGYYNFQNTKHVLEIPQNK